MSVFSSLRLLSTLFVLIANHLEIQSHAEKLAKRTEGETEVAMFSFMSSTMESLSGQ